MDQNINGNSIKGIVSTRQQQKTKITILPEKNNKGGKIKTFKEVLRDMSLRG